ncbi:flagellar biosynthesis protein FlhA [Halodesulfovibrio sp.]|jgi:flagellar biosynthesis protein FlhA|uniref:flagellar biosynthesis protein FlhA n=1 Tax=Halodesulfovibrio sp. TaxID=1912772 RepID=UPI0025E0C39C|nr:flagellar biosynthesis protein FlhA [Halodesulfovibrio sp.]MCT4627001.1 flagellar biosynthesis protein FlhA [Halodesulfovibrio sp.]
MAASANASSINYERFSKHGDILLAGGVVLILFVMLIPIPTLLMDVMLSMSISLALLVLVTSMFIKSPLEFSIFPTLLLVTTLFRLALNVATTRLILLHGSEGPDAAGDVIQSFGQFVVGGNYVIGIVIFAILFILNKMVITSGTTRIAEVAARFTLDAMPGKQMAIEADLSAGILDEKTATQRRETIRREADFYGAMDGAGKFVQGDVMAGLLITIVNITAGILIAVFQKGMPWADALSTYTLLTVGDGLVSTIPSLIISTAAGIIVSRAAAEAKMGEEFMGQLTYNSKALNLVGCVLLVFALVPGMPFIAFSFFAICMFVIARLTSNASDEVAQRTGATGAGEQTGEEPAEAMDTPEAVQSLLPLDALELEVGYGLIPLVDEAQDGNLLSRIRTIRRQFALDMGVIIPSLHLRDNLQLKPGQYTVLIKGNEMAGAEILIDHFLAMDPGDARHSIKGIETREPAFNLPALWVPEVQKEEAVLAGYTVVDPSTVIATHLTEVFKRSLADFLGRQEVQSLLDNLAKHAPKAVEELVPNVLTLGVVQKVLQNLVRENISIRDLLTIVETLADYGTSVKNPEVLTEYVRERLSRTIVRPYMDQENTLPIIMLDPHVEKTVQEAIRQTEGGAYLALDPATAQQVIQAVNSAVESAVVTDGQPIILTSPMVRPHLSQLIMRFIPNIPVISQAEIPADIRLNTVGNVGI